MNPLIAEIPPSIIRALNARKRPGDIDLGLGQPTLQPDPRPFEAALAWIREHGCPYSPNAGFAELRERIASYHTLPELNGPENVCVTVGSEEALYLALKTVVDPARDEVLIVAPCYLAYAKICMLEGIRHRVVSLSPEDAFLPRAAPVLSALRPNTRLVVLNSPCNPTGRIWPGAELRTLAEGLRARGESPIHVLSDEVYRELYFTPEPPASIAEFHPHSLIACSLSKSNALTGLRLGWLLGPEPVITAATKVHQFVNTAASTFGQQVALAMLRDPAVLAAHRLHYRERRDLVLRLAERDRVSLIPPEGTFYAFVRLPERFAGDSMQVAERLLEEQRVVTVPGGAFGESTEGWLRLSWVVDDAALEEGFARIGRLLGES